MLYYLTIAFKSFSTFVIVLNQMLEQLITFLEEELFISTESIALAQKQKSQSWTLFPIILFQYSLISLKELDIILDWIEIRV